MNTQIDNLLNNAFTGLQVTNEQNSEAVSTLLDKYNLRWSVSKQP